MIRPYVSSLGVICAALRSERIYIANSVWPTICAAWRRILNVSRLGVTLRGFASLYVEIAREASSRNIHPWRRALKAVMSIRLPSLRTRSWSAKKALSRLSMEELMAETRNPSVEI